MPATSHPKCGGSQVSLSRTNASPFHAARRLSLIHISDGTNGMRWIENDQVRLLLGPEGAHVYRWELKAAGNRNLTMPGESDWHGFSDQYPDVYKRQGVKLRRMRENHASGCATRFRSLGSERDGGEIGPNRCAVKEECGM